MQKSQVGDPPSSRQAEVFNFILAFAQENLFQPSMAQVSRALGIRDDSGITRHLYYLNKKGYIDTSISGARCIQLVRRTPFTTEEVKE